MGIAGCARGCFCLVQNKWDRVSLFIYHFLWTCVLALLLPFLLPMKGKRLLDRLGWSLPSRPLFRKTIWVHALSVGEVLSSVPLIRAIKERYPSEEVVLTVTTTRGMEVARKELQGEVGALFFMPLDFWWSMGRIVRCIDPALFLLVETDVWPGLIHRLKEKGVPALLLNGRISPRTFRSYRRFRFLARRMLGALKVCLMQSDLDRERLLRVGLEEGKVVTVGNIKFDRVWEPMGDEERKGWLQTLHLGAEDRIWVAGSTHRGEEDIILDVFSELRHSFPRLRLILAPRRIERAPEVLGLGSQRGMKVQLKNALAEDTGPWEVLVMDTMGELGRVYGIGELSFVGGSLVPIGGHNLLEPSSFGRGRGRKKGGGRGRSPDTGEGVPLRPGAGPGHGNEGKGLCGHEQGRP